MAVCSLTMKLPYFPCSSLIKLSTSRPSALSLKRRMSTTSSSAPIVACATPENKEATAEEKEGTSLNVQVDPDRKSGAMERRPRRSALEISPFAGFVDSLSPMRTMRQMLDAVDRIFDDAMIFPTIGTGEIRAPWEMREEDGQVRMRFDVPGLSKEEVKVFVEDDVLVVKGKRKEGGEGEEGGWRKGESERRYDLQVMLPDDCDKEQVKAELKNGVLVVTIPKTGTEKKNVIDVEIQ